MPESDQRSAVMSLGMDPLDAQIRLVSFFDTPDLTLNKNGVVVRARRVQRKGDDSVVKLRPGRARRALARAASLAELRGRGRRDAGRVRVLGIHERDRLERPTSQKVNRGKRPLRKLFSKEQRAFYSEHAPEGLGLDDLSLLGPIFVLKLKFSPAELDRKLVAELWLFPDNSRVLELSTKCAPSEAFQVAAEVRAYLSERGVSLAGEQQAKTSKALEFFSKQLSEPAA